MQQPTWPDQDKLDGARSKVEKLNLRLKSVVEQLTPLEKEKFKIQEDVKYYESRVEKLTARLKEAKNG